MLPFFIFPSRSVEGVVICGFGTRVVRMRLMYVSKSSKDV